LHNACSSEETCAEEPVPHLRRDPFAG
jgi:hypothetical protein